MEKKNAQPPQSQCGIQIVYLQEQRVFVGLPRLTVSLSGVLLLMSWRRERGGEEREGKGREERGGKGEGREREERGKGGRRRGEGEGREERGEEREERGGRGKGRKGRGEGERREERGEGREREERRGEGREGWEAEGRERGGKRVERGGRGKGEGREGREVRGGENRERFPHCSDPPFNPITSLLHIIYSFFHFSLNPYMYPNCCKGFLSLKYCTISLTANI